jgi:hypothetical protein
MSEAGRSIWSRPFFGRISLLGFVLWFFRRRNLPRVIFGLACLVTLIAAFYAEENWRGKHAWEKYRREWEAKGEKFQWQAFIPPPVPDDQNFFMAAFWEDVRVWIDQDRMSDAERAIARSDTNLASRLSHLQLRYYRAGKAGYLRLKTPELGSWVACRETDLKAWQAHYHEPLVPFDAAASATTGKNTLVRAEEGIERLAGPESLSPPEDVLLGLAKYDDTLKLLRLATSRPKSRSWGRYDSNGDIYLTRYEIKIWQTALFLQLLITAELQAGRTNQAFDDLNVLFYLAEILRQEPEQEAFLIHAGIWNKAVITIWQGLAHHRWTDAQLKAMQDRLASLDLFPTLNLAMDGERAMLAYILDEIAANRTQSRFVSYYEHSSWNVAVVTNLFMPQKFRAYIKLAPRGWFEQDKVTASKTLRPQFLPFLPANNSDGIASTPATGLGTGTRLSYLGSYVYWEIFETDPDRAPAQCAQRAAFTQTSLRLAAVACALERYWQANGKYPERPEDLEPHFITKLPHEVLNGQPFKYQRTDDGRFVLTSVGLSPLKNDPRVRVPEVVPTGDWVWRYPAK